MKSQLQSLHLIYCTLTGLEPRYIVYEQAWHDFVRKGFTESDLRVVLLFLQRENRRNTFSYSLALGKLLDFQYHRFSDFLCEAKAKQRNHRPPPTGKEKVMQSWSRTVDSEKQPQPMICQSVKDVLKRIVQ